MRWPNRRAAAITATSAGRWRSCRFPRRGTTYATHSRRSADAAHSARASATSSCSRRRPRRTVSFTTTSLRSWRGARGEPGVSAPGVRALIAHAMLDATASAPHTLGDVTLRPHQRASADRLLELIAHHGGALLADRVGTGKTYTALAVASRERAIIVIAPSSLRDMWRDALATTGVAARIVTHESLSRGDIPTLEPSIVLVDEAHRFRNPATRRYAAAATLCRRAKVLLVSATPIQNARNDLAAQLALFL